MTKIIANMNETEIGEMLIKNTIDEMASYATEQMNAKQGLKCFGENGSEAIKKELQQSIYRKVLHGKHVKSITRQKRRTALQYLMFLMLRILIYYLHLCNKHK